MITKARKKEREKMSKYFFRAFPFRVFVLKDDEVPISGISSGDREEE
jgi:hypothetical protein